MEPLLVYGFPLGSSMGLVAALEWLGQPYRLSRVDMLRQMRNAGYARLNRRLETPVLVTDTGHALSETLAIAQWLEARDVERRISFAPRSAQGDRMHQLMAFINTGFTGAFGPLWTAMEMDPPDPARQALLRELGGAAVVERHDRLEEMVGDGPFLVGERPTLADALLIGVARWLEFHAIADATRWPRLLAIRRRLEADPAVRFALARESGEEVAGNGALRGHLPIDAVIERYGE